MTSRKRQPKRPQAGQFAPNRYPAGSPKGGQFAPAEGSSPEIGLPDQSAPDRKPTAAAGGAAPPPPPPVGPFDKRPECGEDDDIERMRYVYTWGQEEGSKKAILGEMFPDEVFAEARRHLPEIRRSMSDSGLDEGTERWTKEFNKRVKGKIHEIGREVIQIDVADDRLGLDDDTYEDLRGFAMNPPRGLSVRRLGEIFSKLDVSRPDRELRWGGSLSLFARYGTEEEKDQLAEQHPDIAYRDLLIYERVRVQVTGTPYGDAEFTGVLRGYAGAGTVDKRNEQRRLTSDKGVEVFILPENVVALSRVKK